MFILRCLFCPRVFDGTTYTKKLEFLYEGSDIVGVIYTNDDGAATYYYDKNPRGDVIGILDNSGNTVVKYTYDAYGNCNCTYSYNTDLANSNPIRYRSYYYDEDTGLYYLNARYYDPQWRRFISPDDTAYLDIESVNGLNLYCYANNNPIGISEKLSASDYVNSSCTKNIPNIIFENFVSSFNFHIEPKWFDTYPPEMFVFTKNKAAIVDWGLSIYKVYFYFDTAENISLYVGVGNISMFVGYNAEKNKFGAFADVNVLSVGYQGLYVDASIAVVGVGVVFGWQDGEIRFKYDPPGWFGFDLSINIREIISDIF